MKRTAILLGLFALLALIYAAFFTEWLRPAPIEIASQLRFALQPPRFGRPPPPPKPAPGKQPAAATAATNRVVVPDPIERIGRPDKGGLDQAPGGAANVTFSLDAYYRLTRIRVEDVPQDGSAPHVMWEVFGKSRPLNSLLYSRCPEGMTSVVATAKPEPLVPGAPYHLIVQAGRRKGTNSFRTLPLQPSN